MTYFVRKGNAYYSASERALDIHDTLPVGTYTIKVDDMGVLFYEPIKGFTMPSKVYGDLTRNRDRIINTFMDRPSGTGVLLAGEKGSGKTLLAKALSTRCHELDIPTIVINAPLCGEKFNTFIQELLQPAIIIFDEFEKVYDSEDQEKILTLLDGVYPSKKLFIITTNDAWRIDQHMRNRPGRVFYMLEYKGLEPSFVREYATEHLVNSSHVESIVNVCALFKEFNFDMLKAIVEEMNRYNETAQEVMTLLNTKPQKDSIQSFMVRVIDKGVEITDTRLDKCWNGNPLSSRRIVITMDDDKSDEEIAPFEFSNTDLQSVDGEAGKFIYRNESEQVLILTKKPPEPFDYSKFL